MYFFVFENLIYKLVNPPQFHLYQRTKATNHLLDCKYFEYIMHQLFNYCDISGNNWSVSDIIKVKVRYQRRPLQQIGS